MSMVFLWIEKATAMEVNKQSVLRKAKNVIFVESVKAGYRTRCPEKR